MQPTNNNLPSAHLKVLGSKGESSEVKGELSEGYALGGNGSIEGEIGLGGWTWISHHIMLVSWKVVPLWNNLLELFLLQRLFGDCSRGLDQTSGR
jgi:hypothetical protein